MGYIYGLKLLESLRQDVRLHQHPELLSKKSENMKKKDIKKIIKKVLKSNKKKFVKKIMKNKVIKSIKNKITRKTIMDKMIKLRKLIIKNSNKHFKEMKGLIDSNSLI